MFNAASDDYDYECRQLLNEDRKKIAIKYIDGNKLRLMYMQEKLNYFLLHVPLQTQLKYGKKKSTSHFLAYSHVRLFFFIIELLYSFIHSFLCSSCSHCYHRC